MGASKTQSDDRPNDRPDAGSDHRWAVLDSHFLPVHLSQFRATSTKGLDPSVSKAARLFNFGGRPGPASAAVVDGGPVAHRRGVRPTDRPRPNDRGADPGNRPPASSSGSAERWLLSDRRDDRLRWQPDRRDDVSGGRARGPAASHDRSPSSHRWEPGLCVLFCVLTVAREGLCGGGMDPTPPQIQGPRGPGSEASRLSDGRRLKHDSVSRSSTPCCRLWRR